jgi:translation initiation factor 4A
MRWETALQSACCCPREAEYSRAFAVGRYGFEKPSAIQQKGIVPFGKGLDVIQQAQSGTGKTATFCAGILQNLDYNLVECQALVLAPTRELAQQIEKVMRALGDYLQARRFAALLLASVSSALSLFMSGKSDRAFDQSAAA